MLYRCCSRVDRALSYATPHVPLITVMRKKTVFYFHFTCEYTESLKDYVTGGVVIDLLGPHGQQQPFGITGAHAKSLSHDMTTL